MPRINTNTQSLTSVAALKRNNRSLTTTLERLSTGNRINRAACNAAGLSVADQLRAQSTGLGAGNRNIQDGISVLNVAEGALNEVTNILQRLRELAVQASTATLGDKERGFIQLEVEQLTEEIDRISKTTRFNNMRLLSGEDTTETGHRNPWGHENGAALHVGAGHCDDNDLLRIKMPSVSAESLGLWTDVQRIAFNELEGVGAFEEEEILDSGGMGTGIFIRVPALDFNGNQIIYDANDPSHQANYFSTNDNGETVIVPRFNDDGTRAREHIFDSQGNPVIITERTQLLDLSKGPNGQGAIDAITHLDEALEMINGARSQIGAKVNRLEHALVNQMNMHTNVVSAESLIRHTDFSYEAMHMTRKQVLQQSSTAILAQANALPNHILGLLNI